jgi:hypothetical protein
MTGAQAIARIALLPLALLHAVGCTANEPPRDLGGETHWLQPCAGDSDCAQGSQCLCGVCSRPCDHTRACVAPESACVPFASLPAPICSGPAPAPALCLPRCVETRDCAEHNAAFVCSAGHCVPEPGEAPQHAPEAGQAPSDASSNSCDGLDGVCMLVDAGKAVDAGAAEAATDASEVRDASAMADAGDAALLPFQPCTGRACGAECAPCDTRDPGCSVLPTIYFCQEDGTCNAIRPACKVYDPCEFRVCGARCLICEPSLPRCYEPAGGNRYCDKDRQCQPGMPSCL